MAAAMTLALFGVGAFPYVLAVTTGGTRAWLLGLGLGMLAVVLVAAVLFVTRRVHTAESRRSTFFRIGLAFAPPMLTAIAIDGGAASPLVLALLPPAALAAAAFPPRDAAWHIGPIVAGYGFLLVLGPVPPGWMLAMAIGVFLSVVVPIMVVRQATLQYAIEQERRADSFQRLSAVDALTGCLNHGAFHDALQDEIERATAGGATFSLVLLDVDHFKDVNDTLGHLVGDAVLAEIGRLLRSTARANDSVGRIGGEEFAMLLRATDLHGAAALAERVRVAVAAQPGVRVTVSSGVGEWWPGASAGQLRRRVDAVLYDAKRAGRDRVVCVPAA